MSKFKAFRVFQAEDLGLGRFVEMSESDLSSGDLLVKPLYSSINYKDAVAALGKRAILRKYPLNGGIDVVGEILESESKDWKVGDLVLCNGSGLSETRDGGYSERIRLTSDIAIKLNGLSPRESMIYGTAGFTAALALDAMLRNEQDPGSGPILVTGASGGVGSIATMLFSQYGFEVHALTSKTSSHEYLRDLGAEKIYSFEDIDLGSRPLEKVRFAGAVDNLGGEMLSKILKHIGLFGNVASIGLAQSFELSSTVMPHILRGVNLLGISSANTPQKKRQEIWDKLGASWAVKNIDRLKLEEIQMDQLEEFFPKYLANQVQGRVIVKIQ